jgi:iron(III) transport system substrate-binding protein
MRIPVLRKSVDLLALVLSLLIVTEALPASPTIVKANEEARAKGYTFYSSHDELVARAKKEAKLRASSNMNAPTLQRLADAFKQKYPFIADVRLEEISLQDAFQRFILEMKSGQVKGLDVTHIPVDFAQEYPPYLMKYDIFGMAKQGVLKIDPRMIHPTERNMVSVATSIRVLVYNRKLISDDKLPARWEDLLKPEFSGKKFVLDLRPHVVAGLVPLWGLERTVDFARKLAAQQPVWGGSSTRSTTRVASGESAVYLAANYNTVNRVIQKDPTGNLNYKIIEPVPVVIVDTASGLLSTADHPHAGLLFLEFLASPEGQEIIDKFEPQKASLYTPGSAAAQVTKGRELSVVDWGHFSKLEGYLGKIFDAYGFPKADK